MNRNNRLQTVVCGSRFGQFYCEALKVLPEQFELVGLLAKGSERSQKCAKHYGIRLYTEVDQLPASLDLACVVLRSGVMGGSGTGLALKLLARGIHVILEQPVHHRDLASCWRTARQNGVHFQLGDLYVHLPAVRRFIACARVMLEQQNALYIDAACATQVSFPLMHILLEALPAIRPWKISKVFKDEGPWQVLTGVLGKIPIILRAHNEVDPHDSDNHLHLLHRITIGVAGGSLSLIDTHGPVVWHPRLNVPDNHDMPGGLATAVPEHLRENSTRILGPSPVSYQEILLKQWPRAIGRDLSALKKVIQGEAAPDTRAQQELLCSRQWQDLTTALGYPVLRPNSSYQPLAAEILIEAAAKIAEDQEDPKDPINFEGHEDHEDHRSHENPEDPEDPESREQLSRAKTASAYYTCPERAGDGVPGIEVGHVRECVQRLDEAVMSSMLLALQAQGTLLQPEREYSEAEIFSTSRVAFRHQPVIWRWLRVLTERGYLKHLEGGYFLNTDPQTVDMVHRRWDLVKEAWNGKLGSPVIIDYLIANAEKLPQLMSGQQQAALLLFPEGRMDVANALYRDTLMARYLNKSVAEAVMRIVAEKQACPTESSNASAPESLRILEVGAGTGATTDEVVHRLKTSAAKELKPDYLFTDISNYFLAAARRHFRDCPWMSFQIIDIDKNLLEQGLKPESLDIVIAAGMLNNARDTDQVIQGLLQSLVPGGKMLITEPIREFPEMLISQAFMMTSPEDDRKNTRTTFMSVKQWQEVFRRAGAQEVMTLPDERHPLAPLGQKLFIVRK